MLDRLVRAMRYQARGAAYPSPAVLRGRSAPDLRAGLLPNLPGASVPGLFPRPRCAPHGAFPGREVRVSRSQERGQTLIERHEIDHGGAANPARNSTGGCHAILRLKGRATASLGSRERVKAPQLPPLCERHRRSHGGGLPTNYGALSRSARRAVVGLMRPGRVRVPQGAAPRFSQTQYAHNAIEAKIGGDA